MASRTRLRGNITESISIEEAFLELERSVLLGRYTWSWKGNLVDKTRSIAIEILLTTIFPGFKLY